MTKQIMLPLILLIVGCQSGFVPIAQREMYEKEGTYPNTRYRRPVKAESKSTPELYIKRESLEVVPKEKQNFSGSLFSLKDQGNFLYSPPPRGEIGDSIDVKVVANRSDTKENPGQDPVATNPTQNQQTGNDKALNDELLAALPKLAAPSAESKVPRYIKMNVIRQLENGDIVVEALRSSKNNLEKKNIRAVGTIKNRVINGAEEITTKDLENVEWEEIANDEVIERSSSSWEDEYTLRWSGFDEAKSKQAIEIDNSRKELEKIRKRLQERITSSGKERQKLAQDRESINKERKEFEEKISELTKQIKALESQVESKKVEGKNP